MSIERIILSAAIAALLPSSLVAENWPSWRGPRGNGVAAESNVPAEFGPEKNLVWKAPLPGPGGASPVVWEDKVFVTAPAGEALQLICIGPDGKELWKRDVGKGNKAVRGDEGNSCSPSPVTDGQHVWSLMANGDFACYDLSGNETWKLNLQERYGKFRIAFGMTSTPILDGDRLYLQLIHGEGKPSTQEALVVALDKLTGREVWKQTRTSDGTDECESSYASPILYDDGATKVFVSHGNDYVVGHSLDDGRELWRCGGLNPKDNRYNTTLRFVASPAAGEGLIVVPSAKNGPVVALKPNGQGDVTGKPDVQVWKMERNTPDVPSPVIHDGLVYLCRETGDLFCLEAATGKQVYQKPTKRERHRSSPVYADGKIFLTSRDGQVTVVQAGREFKVLAKNDLGEQISASPAVSNGKIYFRTFEHLWCFGTP